jgi:uncharacterized Zn-binding protein involved in type VI secretion
MGTVGIEPPKTPITSGFNKGTAKNTLPNVCKMPGPPPPFVPSPLPNIAKSNMSPKGFSKDVKIEGKTVAIFGASFKSMGDIASKATGGGLISMNTHGEAKFVTPGSLTVSIEGKPVHLKGEPMMNNLGAAGVPPNTGSTLSGADRDGASKNPLIEAVGEKDADALCEAACGAAKDKETKPKTTKTQSLMRERLDKKPRGTGQGTSSNMESGVLTEVGQKIGPGGGPFVGKWGKARSPGAGTKVKWDVILTSKPAPGKGKLVWPDGVKKIVEVKFPGDKLTENQKKMLGDLGKNESKVHVMDVAEQCDCSGPKGKARRPS